jgi:hypothetical protein
VWHGQTDRMTRQRYVIAVRSGGTMPSADWMDRLDEIGDIEVIGRYGGRAQVVATPAAMEAAKLQLGDSFIIERSITHHR